MKKQLFRRIACGLGVMLLFLNAKAQSEKGHYDLIFEDGTSVNLTIFGSKPKDVFTNHVAGIALANHMSVTYELSYSKIIPGSHYLKGGVYAGYRSGGFNGFFASGIFYLGESEIPAKQRITVKMKVGPKSVTWYKADVPCTKGKYWGIHGELGYSRVGYLDRGNFEIYNDYGYLINSVGSAVVAVGFGFNSIQGLHTKTEFNEYIGRTRFFTAIADVVYNPIVKVNATGIDSASSVNELLPKHVGRGTVGFRAYVQMQNTKIYHKEKEVKGCFGYTWRIGLQCYNYFSASAFTLHLGDAEIAPELGFGVFYNFW